MSGQLYVISGPSGVGKSTIIRLLRDRIKHLGYSISYTSRKPRKNEVDGVDYHFVERDTFIRKIEDGEFVEWAEVYRDFYGTAFFGLRAQLNRGLDVIMDVDIQGAKNIKEHFKESVQSYILPPSMEVLKKRLRKRATDDEKVMNERIEKASEDIKTCVFYDYIIINDDLNKSVAQMESIITATRCRKSHVLPRVQELFGLLF
jgi:guanylate kinase